MKYTMLTMLFLMMIGCSSQKEMQDNELLYYGKTACLGKCPVFDLYIYKDGKVVYRGIKNVEKKGKFTATISKVKLEEIKKEILKLDLNDNTNTKSVRDLPNTVIKVSDRKLKFQNLTKIEGLDKLLKNIILNI